MHTPVRDQERGVMPGEEGVRTPAHWLMSRTNLSRRQSIEAGSAEDREHKMCRQHHGPSAGGSPLPALSPAVKRDVHSVDTHAELLFREALDAL
ncbi:hypothetical protein WOLCODRAFT_154160 [Wolfiporia cocos MD-104 SS10]|uniref:Uncharacterized protein n=1 Tax=Wolfiporia cocos (strain MD-104) TaxID=742152 RepID=A0A2H3JRK1_WOLCO|nr:hypothetical protein WOLCODRAFT_154160 [Wolfiporia cocos MD-104 SS10]